MIQFVHNSKYAKTKLVSVDHYFRFKSLLEFCMINIIHLELIDFTHTDNN